jgi:hypothetical protein
MRHAILMMWLLITLTGCGSGKPPTPDKMSRAELETWVKQNQGFTELTLKEQADGTFLGTGIKDGKEFQVKVERGERNVKWAATGTWPGGKSTFEGSRGW